MLDEHLNGNLVSLVAIRLEVVSCPGSQLQLAVFVGNLADGAKDFPVELQDLLAQHKLWIK